MSLPSILFFNLCWVWSIFSQPWIWLQVDHVSNFCCNSENNFKGTLVTVVMLGPRQYELVENVAVQDGWSVELRQRKGGKSEGQLYNVYVNPQRRLFYVLILANGLSSLGLLCFPQQVKGKCSIFFWMLRQPCVAIMSGKKQRNMDFQTLLARWRKPGKGFQFI